LIQFVKGEQLIQNPSEVLQKVESFLGIQKLIEKRHFVHNLRKGFPCMVKPLDSGNVQCLNDQKGRKHPYISEHILARLRQFYMPYNLKLFETIGQTPFWPL